MDAWPTTPAARDASEPIMAGAALSLGLGGIQGRNIADIGWLWSEVFPDFSVRTPAGRAFTNRIARAWNEAEIFTKLHPELKLPLGAGALGYAPVVSGNGQRGQALLTKGWPPNTKVLCEGDPTRIGTLRGVRRVRQDATTDNTGAVILQLNPIILVGSEPADGDTIAWTGVTFECLLGEPPDFSAARSNAAGWVRGLTLTFYEYVAG